MSKRATLASKVSGKRTRKRLFTRDLFGRFSRAKETANHPGSMGKASTRIIKVRKSGKVR